MYCFAVFENKGKLYLFIGLECFFSMVHLTKSRVDNRGNILHKFILHIFYKNPKDHVQNFCVCKFFYFIKFDAIVTKYLNQCIKTKICPLEILTKINLIGSFLIFAHLIRLF